MLKTLVVSENKKQQNKQAIKETHNKNKSNCIKAQAQLHGQVGSGENDKGHDKEPIKETHNKNKKMTNLVAL